jgi:hypothetical protein
MRKPVSALALACALVGVAHADKPKAIEIKPVIDKLDAYRDDLGNVYVVPKPDAFTFDEAQQWVFYGDGKSLYQQRIIGASQEGSRAYEFNLWAPRSKFPTAGLGNRDGKMVLTCGRGKDMVRTLKQLNADEARTLFQHATFLPPLWQRQAHLLARDDDAIYYFIDELREEYGGNGLRVFVGAKGAMKELPMTNTASDSAGEIYATKSGQLKIIKGKDDKAWWIKGGKKTELALLEPPENRYLIYRELGIYGPLGAVCDDL